MKGIKSDRALRAFAILANLASFFVVLFIGLESSPHGSEFGVWLVLMLAPVSTLFAFWRGPSREERELRKRVAIAELRHRLKELGEGGN